MHLVSDAESGPIAETSELYDYFVSGGKPPEDWRVGTEYEMCGVYRSSATAPPYEGDNGIAALLAALEANGWKAVKEREKTIALVQGDSQVTIEPGGQFEFAARPVTRAAELDADLRTYLVEVCRPSAKFDIAWLSVGMRPFGSLESLPWMPKQRYEIMRDYLPTRGALALDMMKKTATVQVNLDFADVRDAGRKLRCVHGVSPILTALYANSPISEGQANGYQSYRAHIWRHTDPDRCGLLPFVFEDVDVFEHYVEWALDVPMFFVHRGQYLAAKGITFRQFIEHGFEGHRATIDDWSLHLSTLFPEARLKKYLEVRSCDVSSVAMILALGPFCRGMLYDDAAIDAALELTGGLSWSQRLELHDAVPRQGLSTPIPGSKATVLDWARELVAIVKRSLRSLDELELPYIECIEEVAATARTPADAMLDLWRAHGDDCSAFIAALSYGELSRC